MAGHKPGPWLSGAQETTRSHRRIWFSFSRLLASTHNRYPKWTAVSKVLDADDILIEILIRIGFPTTLVCAALVCKRWLGHVASRAFLGRFRELHLPRLLGVYVEEMGLHLHARSVLVGNKIYIPAGLNDIIVLDFTVPSLSTIQLPLGVEHGKTGTTMLARAEDASCVYLIHLKEFELRAWLHKGDNWLPADIICLREMCANLGLLSDEHTLLFRKQVVDYGDFIFLEMGGCALHLDNKCRTLRKVYQAKEGHLIGVNPFMMI